MRIANTLRLLTLPDMVRSLIEDGKLTAGHARTLGAADSPEELADQFITKELQKGYLLKTRLLRPAMVVVARNPQKSVKVDLKV